MGASCFRVNASAIKLEPSMSIIIKDKDSSQEVFLHPPPYKDMWKVRSLVTIPQQILDCTTRVELRVTEDRYFYGVTSTGLSGVELENLWICIEGRTLTLYAGITGKEHEDGGYRFAKELLGGIRGEVMLPEGASQRPREAVFWCGMLALVFPREVDESSE